MTDSAGNVVCKYDYDPFGGSYANHTSAAIEQRYTYTGRETNPVSLTMYYRYRTYDPGAGRFAQRDPIGYIAGMNLYVYVENHPNIYKDYLGFYKIIWVGDWSKIQKDKIEQSLADIRKRTVYIIEQIDNILESENKKDCPDEDLVNNLIGLKAKLASIITGIDSDTIELEFYQEDIKDEDGNPVEAKLVGDYEHPTPQLQLNNTSEDWESAHQLNIKLLDKRIFHELTHLEGKTDDWKGCFDHWNDAWSLDDLMGFELEETYMMKPPATPEKGYGSLF